MGMNLIRVNNWTVEFVNPTFNHIEVREAWHEDSMIPLPLPDLFTEGCTGDQFFGLLFCLKATNNNEMAQKVMRDTSF
jgi:hypothetical protein